MDRILPLKPHFHLFDHISFTPSLVETTTVNCWQFLCHTRCSVTSTTCHPLISSSKPNLGYGAQHFPFHAMWRHWIILSCSFLLSWPLAYELLEDTESCSSLGPVQHLAQFLMHTRLSGWLKMCIGSPETSIQKNLCTPMFIAAQFTIAKSWKQPKCPSTNEWTQKLWYIYTMEFYTAERKKELIPFATAWMELESIILSEISQAVRDKYHMISPLTGTQSTEEKKQTKYNQRHWS